jgi:uncharacterized protein (DUF1778 family)
MPTKNPRVNVTFEEATLRVLAHAASHENKSLSSFVKELALEALEMREDLYLSKLAEKLDKDQEKTYSHIQAWK